MTPGLYVTHAAQVVTKEGPTGRYVEVLVGEVQDYGGNVLFHGTADECVEAKFRVPTRLVPKAWRSAAVEIAGAEHTWAWVEDLQ